jgi:NAD(P)H dehydrogenase (quinone)
MRGALPSLAFKERQFYQAAREGYFADVDPLLGDLLGRQPGTVRDLLAE